MPTNTASECRESLQKMTFQQAVSSLYRKSNGLVFLVAVKYKDEVLINPAHQKVEKGTESDIDRKTGQKMKDREEYSWTLGDCEAIFVIAPSWETAWEIMSEETEEDDETADVDYLDTTKQVRYFWRQKISYQGISDAKVQMYVLFKASLSNL
jgi:hypothetical protein